MRKIALALAILGTTLTATLFTAPAHAQATRTWVSGVGDDANQCSRTAPCKTWAGAISKTAPGGEIDALDPGGFGAVTITKSITLDGGGGQVASTLASGLNGIVIQAAATDFVTIRNLRIFGAGTTLGTNGIRVTAAAQVTIDNCDIYEFSNNGIDVETSATTLVAVRNTTLRNNGANAVFAASPSGFAVVQVSNSSIVGKATFTQGGVNAGTGGAISVFNTTFQDLSQGANVSAGGILNVDSSFFSSMTTGILTAAGTTQPTNVNNNSFYNAGTAFGGAGTYLSASTNHIGSGTAQGATPGAMTVK